jgi:8-oxo-dGTP diphosphatase
MLPDPAPKPTPVVCAIIEHEGRCLIAQRPEGKRLAGFWEFPGGKVERGESPVAALHRELAEELGCCVEITAAVPAVRHAYEWGSILLFPFRCRLAAGSAQPTAHEHSALTWQPVATLSQFSLAPADLPVLAWLRRGPDDLVAKSRQISEAQSQLSLDHAGLIMEIGDAL